jgi:toxin ParE1/3/4
MRPVKLRYTQRARRQLDAIHDYLTERNPDAALRVVTRIREFTRLLEEHPSIGRMGTLPDTRELVVPRLPYIIVYRMGRKDKECAEILAVFHTAQDRARQGPL